MWVEDDGGEVSEASGFNTLIVKWCTVPSCNLYYFIIVHKSTDIG